jgi:hypothetical protein
MVLFENYYYDVIMFAHNAADEIYINYKNGDYEFIPQGIKISAIVNDVEIYLRLIYKLNTADSALATELSFPSRRTVTIRPNEKRRRVLPNKNAGALIDMNIANIINKFHSLRYRVDIALGKGNLKKYMHKIADRVYSFNNDTPPEIIKTITKVFMESEFFDKELTHELQHYMDPRAHNWMPKTRNKEISPYTKQANIESKNKLTTKELQVYINYLLSDAEVNSAIADTAMHVIRVRHKKRLLNRYTPAAFVKSSIRFLTKIGKWNHYTPDIQKKVMSKLTLIYNTLRSDYLEKQPIKKRSYPAI